MKIAESSPNGPKTVGKGEIASFEEFLLFIQCFQILILQTHKKRGLLGIGLRVAYIG